MKRLTVIFLVSAGLLLITSSPAPTPSASFRLPLNNYPVDDGCYYSWGAINPYLLRCGVPTRHVADDACAPSGTDVFAVADGWVRYASMVGECTNNWGWITVTEHMYNGSPVCAIYGHCMPLPGITPGMAVTKGQHIADIEWPCGAHHIHFGIYVGPYSAPDGVYPFWLHGYLPDGASCPEFPAPYPSNYVDPVAFILSTTTPVKTNTWGNVKSMYEQVQND